MNKPDETTLTLEYSLYDLPTAQHKAGLAGLILLIESMKKRKMASLPEVEYDSTKAKVMFSERSLQALFDDLYDASWEEIKSKSQWKGKPPKREMEIETSDGKKTKTKYYVYDHYVPKGEFLKSLLPDGGELWLKLWRDMLWETLRGRPTTRTVYEERANKQPSSEGVSAWRLLVKSAEHRAKGQLLTDSVVSSAFIGAQASNAENIPFQGTVEHNLLLHFWPIASLTFVPGIIKKNEKSKRYQMEEVGFALAVPEPANLKDFVTDMLDLLGRLETTGSVFRPLSALITVPEESGLEFFYRLAGSRVGQQEISYSLAGIEIYHMEKRGNNSVMLAAQRIFPNERVLKEYDALRTEYRNPLYRSQRIRNVLSQQPWYTSMDSGFSQYPCELFVYNPETTPQAFPFFGYNVKRTFADIVSNLRNINSVKGGDPMSAEVHDEKLASCVYGLTQEYVHRRTEEKSGKKYEDFKKNKDEKGRVIYPQEYRGALGKVCADAFLAMRGRREQDFVEYFTGTICSVAQYLPEADYLILSGALMTQPNTVKTLSMLALSASSTVGRASENDHKEEGG
jgi:CRISPR-associated protein Cmx8